MMSPESTAEILEGLAPALRREMQRKRLAGMGGGAEGLAATGERIDRRGEARRSPPSSIPVEGAERSRGWKE